MWPTDLFVVRSASVLQHLLMDGCQNAHSPSMKSRKSLTFSLLAIAAKRLNVRQAWNAQRVNFYRVLHRQQASTLVVILWKRWVSSKNFPFRKGGYMQSTQDAAATSALLAIKQSNSHVGDQVQLPAQNLLSGNNSVILGRPYKSNHRKAFQTSLHKILLSYDSTHTTLSRFSLRLKIRKKDLFSFCLVVLFMLMDVRLFGWMTLYMIRLALALRL